VALKATQAARVARRVSRRAVRAPLEAVTPAVREARNPEAALVSKAAANLQ
jgi:hypothetical protein